MGEQVRRCAFAGCDEPIEDVVGRPQRRYCCPAHRQAARQVRRVAAKQARQAADEPAEAALAVRAAAAEEDWLAAVPPAARPGLPEWARSAGLVSAEGYRPGRARSGTPPVHGWARPVARPARRRALAVIGAASLVGYALSSLSTESAAAPTQPAGVQAVPPDTVERRWVARAQVNLTALDQQLELIARTERAVEGTGGPWSLAEPMRGLAERKVLLERRRAALLARMDTVASAQRARGELARAEQRLAAAESALRNGSRGGAEDAAALAEQRELRRKQRDGRRRELHEVAADAAAVVQVALPDDARRTAELVDRVMTQLSGSRGRTPGGPAAGAGPAEDTTAGDGGADDTTAGGGVADTPAGDGGAADTGRGVPAPGPGRAPAGRRPSEPGRRPVGKAQRLADRVRH